MKQLAGMGAALALALSGCEKKAEPLPSTPHEKSLTPVEQRDPVLPRAPAVYVVQKGDTLSRIAKELGVSARELVKANDLPDANRIREGQILVLPERELARKEGARPEQPKREATEPSKEEIFSKVKAGNVPVLRYEFMPQQTNAHLATMSAEIRKYALEHNLPKMGPAICGRGSCNAFQGAMGNLWKLSDIDAVFADPKFYLLTYGSQSRDAYKIREVLDTLASNPDSGWVRVSIRDLPRVKGCIVRHGDEGQMYHPGKFPGGVLICYDPDPKYKSSGSGGRSWGHIEWCTVDQKGNRWFVHAVNSEVSGGSPFCRQQFNRDMLHPELPPNCRVYVLTTPECKREWVARQEVASSYRQAQR